jgi:hypothetical protein
MLFGAGSQAIPDQYQDREGVKVQLLIIDGQGKLYQERPRVMLDRSEQLRRQKKQRERGSARNLSRGWSIKQDVTV